MKRTNFFILIILLLALGAGVSYYFYSSHRTAKLVESEEKIAYYTCSMHPQVHAEEPGTCPICGMNLVPVYESTPGAHPGHTPEATDHTQHTSPSPTETKPTLPSVTISSERQQLIGVKTTIVKRQPVVKEIRTTGTVAYDPELATAIREYVEISRTVPTLRQAARQRLRLLGLSEGEINSLGSGHYPVNNLYLPNEKGPVWVYATLYQSDMDAVKAGMPVALEFPDEDKHPLQGFVRSVNPVIDPNTRTVKARVEVPRSGHVLKPNTYLNVTIQANLGDLLTIPPSALIDTGERQMVFVVHNGTHFQAKSIRIGEKTDDAVVVRDGLTEGEVVVSSATFMVDSEAQLKGTVSGGSGHQH